MGAPVLPPHHARDERLVGLPVAGDTERQHARRVRSGLEAHRRHFPTGRRACNATTVWCPNIDYPDSPNPSFASLYPGDDYVDWTCLDGYNWGTNRSSGWQSFDTVYNYSYHEILEFAPSKPMMIGEFGSVEQGGSKAEWFADALATQLPQQYKQMRAAVYFNWQFDGVDWRIETTAESQDAWRAAIASPYYPANQYGALETSPIPAP